MDAVPNSPALIHPIEAQSYRILAARVDLSGWPEDQRAVVARMVHATADESFATSTRIGSDAVAMGVAALRAGVPVICDARMVLAGIRSVRGAVCFLDGADAAHPDGSPTGQTGPTCADSGTMANAADGDDRAGSTTQLGADAASGLTRSAYAVRLGARRHPVGALWVFGNAPTALAELLALHDAGRVEPAAVIGLPVGYVGAAQAKAQLWASGLRPISITNQGERGGSSPAAAAVNALLRLADVDEPGAR